MSDAMPQSNPLPSKKNTPDQTLEPRQIAMIEEALRSLGDFGEVRLIVEKGRLRFVVTNKSYDALKWQPGSIGPQPESVVTEDNFDHLEDTTTHQLRRRRF